MLKVRVIPTLLFKEFGLVKGRHFRSDRRVGDAMQALRVYNRRDVDEMVFLDVAATPQGRPPDFAYVDQLADECFMPLTVGGGVRSPADIGALLSVGADKVALNSAGLNDPELIAKGASEYGRQCVVVAIDVRREDHGWRVYGECGAVPTGYDVLTWAREAEQRGAGEIILTSIDRDGTMAGYDVDLIKTVTDGVRIPVVASGGAGAPGDAVSAVVVGGASAVAAASVFHFTEITPRDLKLALHAEGVPVRM